MLLELPHFEWIPAHSVQETCALLAQHGEGTLALAGGTDVFSKMKLRRLVPKRLIDIKNIAGLNGLRTQEGGMRIGALASAQEIAASAVPSGLTAITQAAAVLGTLQIRNSATIGGNLANASPSAEFAPPLLALGGSVRCVSCASERSVPIEEFLIGPGKTVLRGDELITEIRVPPAPAGAKSIYLKHSLRRMDVAVASAAVMLVLEGAVCKEARIALGAVAPTPLRAKRAEAAIRGQALSEQVISEVAALAAEESAPIDDLRANANYRRKLVAMLVGKGLERLAVRPKAKGAAAR